MRRMLQGALGVVHCYRRLPLLGTPYTSRRIGHPHKTTCHSFVSTSDVDWLFVMVIRICHIYPTMVLSKSHGREDSFPPTRDPSGSDNHRMEERFCDRLPTTRSNESTMSPRPHYNTLGYHVYKHYVPTRALD